MGLVAIVAIVLEFFDASIVRQICRFNTAIICGFVIREYCYINVEKSFIISAITIVTVVLIISIKELKKSREELDNDVE